jgi:CDP-diacylglycerol--serine O-phosphatidyltransferase
MSVVGRDSALPSPRRNDVTQLRDNDAMTVPDAAVGPAVTTGRTGGLSAPSGAGGVTIEFPTPGQSATIAPARNEWAIHHEFTIANALTTASLAAGFAALLVTVETGSAPSAGRLRIVVALICVAAILDAVDGPIARRRRTAGAFGCNLDSLADVVSFGAVPAVALYAAQLSRFSVIGALVSAAFCTCAAWRLARFPLCKRSGSFVGCPVPAAAVIAGVVATVASSALGR